jgi:cellulose synthase/poly-beta-1,6-N-acetylglucosamine synthase-like glycosyltransferase
MNVLRPLGRHRLGLSCGIFGNGFALSAATLARVPYTPNSLVEDLEYHLHLIRAGIRVEFLNHAAVFGEMPDTTSAAASQRARWEGGRILMRRLWTRPLALEVLRGRPRLLEPLLDLLALPLATEAALLAFALLIGLPMQLAWLSDYAAFGIATLILYVLVAASLAPDPWATLQALASAPAFLAFKLMMVPRTRLAARRDAAWVRTQRNADHPEDR